MSKTNTQRFPQGEYWVGDKKRMWRHHHRLVRATGRQTIAHRIMSANVNPSPDGRPLAVLAARESEIEMAAHGS